MNSVPNVEQVIQALTAMSNRRRDSLNDQGFRRQAVQALAASCGGEKSAILELWRRVAAADGRLRKLEAQNKELVAFIKALEKKALLGWVLSGSFTLNGDGRRFVYAMPLARDAAPQCYEIAEDVLEHENGELPAPPFLGLIQQEARVFFGPAAAPPAPIPAEILRAVSSRDETSFSVGEIEVTDGPDDRKFTVAASVEIAREVRRKVEEGESVHVRVERGVVTGIHASEERSPEEWLEFIETEGPCLRDLVLSRKLHRELDKCVRRVAAGESVSLLLMGPTGTGKTTTAVNFARDVYRFAERAGEPKRGCALVHVGAAYTGSSYINQSERNMRRAVKRAEALAKQGYAVVLILDEGDALVGDLAGGLEHAHNRSEKLTVQSLLGRGLDGPVAVFLTMNARRQSFLPAAIRRRFRLLEYPRPTRSQIAAVAGLYAARHPRMLDALGMPAEEFGEAISLNLFSDERVAAVAHMHSGREMVIRARDLQTASPGKVKELIGSFAFDVEEGEADGLDDLWGAFDREFRAPDLNKRNIWQLTFLTPASDDDVRTVEIAK